MSKGRAAPSKAHDAPRYVARVPFDYGATALDRGQITTLAGAANDEKLTRLGYLALLDTQATTYQCAQCGAEFVGVHERTAHGDKRHRERRRRMADLRTIADSGGGGAVTYAIDDEEDREAEREDRMLDQIAPLYLEKTRASGGS